MDEFKYTPQRREKLDKLEEIGNVKARVFHEADKLLPESCFQHDLTMEYYRRLRQRMEDALVTSTSTDLGELQALTTKVINDSLNEWGMEKPTMARDFLEKLMARHIS
ncbi:MAG: hypothetical protein JO019_02800 [Candidatus Kaiserbacteria bacterium]|nr:hypothetical protein [Candidatus Kaiserbacteria bacterium]